MTEQKYCPYCGYSPIYKEEPEAEAPHLYYCHACYKGFDVPRTIPTSTNPA